MIKSSSLLFFIILLVLLALLLGPILSSLFPEKEKYINSLLYRPRHLAKNIFLRNLSTRFPWWNTQYGTTRNMSYDLRGDVPISTSYVGPWNISSYHPIQNKPLYMVS